MTDWPGTPVQQSQWPGTARSAALVDMDAPRAAAGDFFKSIPRGMLGGFSSAASAGGSAAQTEMGQEPNVPSGPEGQSIVEQNVTGPLHQPAGRAGRFGASVGEALGNPVSYIGPGGVLPKIGNAVRVGLGSEAGSQLAEGTAAEPYARIAGGIAAGAPGVRTVQRPPRAPTRNELAAATDADYGAARASGLEIDPNSSAGLASRLHQDLVAAGHDPFDPQTATVFRAIDQLRNQAFGGNTQIGDIDRAQSALGIAGRNPTNRAATTMARGGIENYLDNIPPADVVAGNPARTSQLFRNGRSNAAAGFRSDEVSGALDRADRQASKTGTGGNEDNTVRQRADSIINKGDFINGENRLYGYTPEETTGLRGVVDGSNTGNTLRWLGRAAPTGPITMGAEGGGIAGALASGHPGVAMGIAGVAGGSYGAKKIADLLTRRRMNAVDDMTRRRSALGEAMPPEVGTGAGLNYGAASPVAAMISGLTARNRDQ